MGAPVALELGVVFVNLAVDGFDFSLISCVLLCCGVLAPRYPVLSDSCLVPSLPITSQEWEALVLRGPDLRVLQRVYKLALATCERVGDAQLALQFLDVSSVLGCLCLGICCPVQGLG